MPTNIQPTPEAFIHRHCMQRILHEAINNGANQCFGLLAGSGNLITNNFHVTEKLLSSNTIAPNSLYKETVLGAYIATDKQNISELKSLINRHALRPENGLHTTYYYLIIHLDHKGRVDAKMYKNMELHTPVTLNMQEASAQKLDIS